MSMFYYVKLKFEKNSKYNDEQVTKTELAMVNFI